MTTTTKPATSQANTNQANTNQANTNQANTEQASTEQASTEQATRDPFAAAQNATEQARQISEQAIVAGRAVGRLALDSYEQAVTSFVEFEQKAAEAAPVDWLKTAIAAHASFIEDLNAGYVRVARAAL